MTDSKATSQGSVAKRVAPLAVAPLGSEQIELVEPPSDAKREDSMVESELFEVIELLEIFEAKPVEIADSDAVERLRNDIFHAAQADELVIPSFPAAAARVLELLQQPDIEINQLVRALHWEPATVTKIVAFANSVSLRRKPVDDLRAAVIALGLNEVGSIAAAVAARSLFEVDAKAEYDLFPHMWAKLHEDTLTIAFTASWLAQSRRMPRHDRVFLRAILEGTGRSLALRALAKQILAKKLPPKPSDALVFAALDAVHDQVRILAFERWDLPASVTLVIDPDNKEERTLVTLVDAISELRRAPHRLSTAEVVLQAMATLGLDRGWLRVMVREFNECADRVEQLSGSKAKSVPVKTARPNPSRSGG